MSAVLTEPPRRRTRSGRYSPAAGIRADIQALRALAVGLVVLYHFWPSRLTGGFVGVDVFFVISGFLITSHLLGKPPRSGRDLADFWGRRIRRLLPASFIVLVVTLVATVLVAPRTAWVNTGEQVAASALYIENWFLAAQAIDYLAADTAPSPVQHFWSLSVEEQFYLVWPVLILLALWVAARARREVTRYVAAGLAVTGVVAASFAASVWLTTTDPAAAYFVTWTRLWELGIGALAACIFPWLQRQIGERFGAAHALRVTAAWIGLAMIVAAAVLFSSATPFPGYAAALPVVGTALVLLAAVERGRLSPLRAMQWRPVQLSGDLSYSIYLWHWPALILVPFLLRDELSSLERVVVIVLVFFVSWLTKRYVEDPFRGRKPLGEPLWRSFVFMIVGVVLIAGAGIATAQTVRAQLAASQEAVDTALDDARSCFGADALVTDGCPPHGDELVTDPAFAATDQPAPYTDGCWVLAPYDNQKTCHYGSDDDDALRVALVGNSHAGHWLPALEEIARGEEWSITTYLSSVCYTVDLPLDVGPEPASENCLSWNQRVIDEVDAGDYDLVVFSNRTFAPVVGMNVAASREAARESYAATLNRWADSDTAMLVLRDNPYATDVENVPDCVAANLDDLSACDGTREREVGDPLADVARELQTSLPTLRELDLTDRLCRGEVCYSVVGGVIAYFDRGHLSATFVRSLSPTIEAAAQDALAARSSD